MRIAVNLPVFMKESRSRMRGLRGPALLFGCTALAIAAVLAVVAPQWPSLSLAPVPGSGDKSLAWMGWMVALVLSEAEAVLCALVIPGTAASAIALEREKRTFELLLLTRLSAANLVLGKLLSALAPVAMALACGLPVASIAFMMGGASPGQVLWSLGVILATTLCLACIGLYCSSWFRRTDSAVLVAYLITFCWVFLLPVLCLGGYAATDRFGYGSYDVLPAVIKGIALALAPAFAYLGATAVSAPLALALKRPPSRAFGYTVFAALTLFFAAINYLLAGLAPAGIGMLAANYPEYVLLGNPLAAIVHQLDAWALIWPDWYYIPWTIRYYTPLCVAVQLLFAGLFLGLTIRRVGLMRRQTS